MQTNAVYTVSKYPIDVSSSTKMTQWNGTNRWMGDIQAD